MRRQETALDESGSGFTNRIPRCQVDAAARTNVSSIQRDILTRDKRQCTRRTLNVRVDEDIAGPTCRRQDDRSATTCRHARTDGFRSTRNQKDISRRRRNSTGCRKRSRVCDRDVATRLGDPGDVQRKAIHKADVAGG